MLRRIRAYAEKLMGLGALMDRVVRDARQSISLWRRLARRGSGICKKGRGIFAVAWASMPKLLVSLPSLLKQRSFANDAQECSHARSVAQAQDDAICRKRDCPAYAVMAVLAGLDNAPDNS